VIFIVTRSLVCNIVKELDINILVIRADICVATALQFIDSVDAKYVRLPGSTREAFKNPALANEFKDLLAWRDNLFEKHWVPASQSERG
jgi:hypothetical protein